ncbi:hypothetical protein LWI29_004256 [Acer saccharum]|uniref:RNA polymerase subunit H/Rpb5 C-terminal domain-containing protein n=1 Tax=Acer saccharum TaxID=4024 RepID=A0AA39SH58_ACESA|nr:hypothetical protein LWI29_004256 [Acer saccharum]
MLEFFFGIIGLWIEEKRGKYEIGLVYEDDDELGMMMNWVYEIGLVCEDDDELGMMNWMLVMFLGTDQVKTKDIREMFMQIVNRESLQGLILILQSKVTAYAKKEMEKFSFKVELFQITDLLVNITKHILTPKYEILNAAKKHNILKKYEVEEKQVDSVTIIVTIINI